MTFDAYDRSLSLIRALVPLLDRLVTIDPKLADQIRRAAKNVALNCWSTIRLLAKTAAIASSGASLKPPRPPAASRSRSPLAISRRRSAPKRSSSPIVCVP